MKPSLAANSLHSEGSTHHHAWIMLCYDVIQGFQSARQLFYAHGTPLVLIQLSALQFSGRPVL